ncbi:MAG: hypothetical protein H7222_00070 [Methylotenera sp.]|nr:hypothetical protein [Oligoflexia bacterium]
MKTHGNRVEKSSVAPLFTLAALVASAMTACAPAQNGQPGSADAGSRSLSALPSGANAASNSGSVSAPASVPHIPLRIGREFFERQLQAQVNVTNAEVQSSKGSVISPIIWEEGAPAGPAPQPGAIADFRDRPGCAKLSEQGSMQVCFVVVPDVSSLDVTAEKVTLQGYESVAATKGCQGAPDQIKFVSGQKDENSLKVSFIAEYGTRCGPQMIEVQFLSL